MAALRGAAFLAALRGAAFFAVRLVAFFAVRLTAFLAALRGAAFLAVRFAAAFLAGALRAVFFATATLPPEIADRAPVHSPLREL